MSFKMGDFSNFACSKAYYFSNPAPGIGVTMCVDSNNIHNVMGKNAVSGALDETYRFILMIDNTGSAIIKHQTYGKYLYVKDESWVDCKSELDAHSLFQLEH